VPKADIDGSKSVALAVLYENDHLMPIPYGSGQQCALRALQLVHLSLRAINNKGVSISRWCSAAKARGSGVMLCPSMQNYACELLEQWSAGDKPSRSIAPD